MEVQWCPQGQGEIYEFPPEKLDCWMIVWLPQMAMTQLLVKGIHMWSIEGLPCPNGIKLSMLGGCLRSLGIGGIRVSGFWGVQVVFFYVYRLHHGERAMDAPLYRISSCWWNVQSRPFVIGAFLKQLITKHQAIKLSYWNWSRSWGKELWMKVWSIKRLGELIVIFLGPEIKMHETSLKQQQTTWVNSHWPRSQVNKSHTQLQSIMLLCQQTGINPVHNLRSAKFKKPGESVSQLASTQVPSSGLTYIRTWLDLTGCILVMGSRSKRGGGHKWFGFFLTCLYACESFCNIHRG